MLPFLAFGVALSTNEMSPISIDGMLAHPRNLMVKYASDEALSGLKVLRKIPQIHWAIVEAPVGQLRATRLNLEDRTGIEVVTYDRAAKAAYTPNDPMWSDQWHSRAIKVDLAWDTSLGSNASVVAVLDTGVQVSHPDLAANIWVNAGEIPNNGIDDDGNGYVDDVNGYDFANNDNDPDDDAGHGTACAGLVGAVGDNGIGVSGVAPRTRIMAVKAGLSSGYFYDSATVPAYIYAADNGAKVFSMSYYSDQVSQAEADALTYAVGKGVLPVAAAGNDSTIYPYYPGAYENVLSVAALDYGFNKAGFSDYGSWVDVAAPGIGLATTATGSNYTTGFAGTSGACPQVAGLAALLFGTNPSATAVRVRRAIEDTATVLNQAPFGEFANYGAVDAEAALHTLLTHPAPAKPSKVVYVTPIGSAAAGQTVSSRIYGRSLTNASLKVGATSIPMTRLTRDYADYQLPTTTGKLRIKAGGTLLATFDPPVADDFVYPLIEGSSPGANVFGGFVETLNADNNGMRVTRRSDKYCLLQATFRKVPKSGKMTLVLKTKYTGSAQGTEYIQLYNWAGASYPYNVFDTIKTRAIGDDKYRLKTIHVPNIAPYVDFEGTVYLRILADNEPSGAELVVDQAYLRKGYF